jgi:hypothetical protein
MACRLCFFLFLVFRQASSSAQDAPPVRDFVPYAGHSAVRDTPATNTPRTPGTITVLSDPRVEKLLQDHAHYKHPQQGYRVQIHLGDRKTAEETKRTFLQKYPEIPAYVTWLAPNFRLRVGDLRTRIDAERLLNELKAQYPGAYIVPDEIEMPRIPEGR